MKWLVVLIALVTGSGAAWAEDYTKAREALLAEIRDDRATLREVLGRDRLAPMVEAAMLAVPRHEFVPADERRHAYENRPLAIGYGQTISQPLIVALMTDLLKLDADDRVFELGTGSGYQAAVLARIAREVYTVEIVPQLGERAKETFARLDYQNVKARVGDGYYGWPEAGPFDAIIVTAAGDHVPPPLVEQLKPGGRMVMPVGSHFLSQQLVLVTKATDGSVQVESLLAVAFVPLTGGH